MLKISQLRFKNKKKNFRQTDKAAYLFLAPSLICVTIFVLLPFVDAVKRSFFSAMSGQFVGLKNYQSIFSNEAFLLAAKNTSRFIVMCIPLLILISLFLALVLSSLKEKKGIFKTTFLIPMAIPVASIVLLWRVLFHRNGLLNIAMEAIGQTPIDWIHTDWAFGILIFSYLWKNAGYTMILWLSGISGISPALYESGQIDGANSIKRFRYITLPSLLPTLFTIAVLSFLNSFKVFREAYLIAGDYPHSSIYMLQHLFNNWFVSLDIDKMCAAATVVAVVVFLFILLFQKMWGKEQT